MKIASLYKITNIINNMIYYGIVYGKNKTVLDRFNDHMTGKGGKILFEKGVCEYGPNNFIVEILETGELGQIAALEVSLIKGNLWPTGYNGNAAHAFLLTPEQHEKSSAKKRARYQKDPTTKPVPPNWRGKRRSDRMKSRVSNSKMGHSVSTETRQKLSKANIGKLLSSDTKEKIKESLAKNENAYGRKSWLAISPTGKMYHQIGHGNKEQFLASIGCVYSSTLHTNLNTGIPVFSPRKGSKNHGWTFYNDKELIMKILEEHNNG